MGSFSDYLENAVLNHVLGAVTLTPPGTVYVGLWTATLADNSDGSTAGEVSGTNYARVAVVNGTAGWPVASGGTKSNGGTITFPTAGADWGTVTDFAILNAAAAGTILVYGTVSASKIIQNGDTASFAVSGLTVTLS